MYFDTHAHLNFAAFVRDRERVAKKCLKQQIWMINVGTNFFTSEIAVDFAKKFDKGVYAAVGLHPINLGIEDSRKVSEAEILSKDSPFEKEFDYESYKNLVLGKNLDSSGIETYKQFSAAKAKTVGASKGKYNFLIPASAEDFTGLLYKMLGKGKKGDAQMAFLKTNLSQN